MLTELEPNKKRKPKSTKHRRLPGGIGPLIHVGRLFTPDSICRIGIPSLKKLAESASPSEVYPLIKGFKDEDFDDVASALQQNPPPEEFTALMGEIVALASDEGVQLLSDSGVSLDGDSTGEISTNALLNDPIRFRSAHARRLDKEGIFSGNCYIRRSTGIGPNSVPNSITNNVLAEIESQCRLYFVNRNYGPVVKFSTWRTTDRTGLIIIHGSRRSGHAAIDPSEKRVPRYDRHEKTSILIYEHDTRFAWVMTNKGDVDFLSQIFGKALFGDGRVFGHGMTFDLSFAKENNLKGVLLGIASTGIDRVRLSYRKIEDTPSGKLEQPAGRNECVTDRYPALTAAQECGNVTHLKLGVELERVSEKSKPLTGTIVIKENCLKIPSSLPESISKQILRSLGVLPTNGN